MHPVGDFFGLHLPAQLLHLAGEQTVGVHENILCPPGGKQPGLAGRVGVALCQFQKVMVIAPGAHRAEHGGEIVGNAVAKGPAEGVGVLAIRKALLRIPGQMFLS